MLDIPKEHESQIYNNAVYFVETDKIKPNPFQPRREFDQMQLEALADSIRMYGVLQPLVVTRHEVAKSDGGLAVEYELISGERRLRASKIAGIPTVPVIIRSSNESDRMKLELAIIENLQREDLNPVDRAMAFKKLADTFGFKHAEIGKKVGKSREFVSNSLRILSLPEDMLKAIVDGTLTEGHTRPLLMLIDRPEEQKTLFKEIVYRGVNVRDAELIARRIAYDKARKKERMFDADLIDLEEKMTEKLGTRVHIEKRKGAEGGKIQIDYYSSADLQRLLDILEADKKNNMKSEETLNQNYHEFDFSKISSEGVVKADENNRENSENKDKEDQSKKDEDLYSLKDFSI